jgi:hypothetical protein
MPQARRIRASELNDSDRERFWARVQKLPGPNGCWLWKSIKNTEGYGRFYLRCGDREWLALANRVSYALAHGEVPAGRCLRLTCGDASCVPPEHWKLMLGR